MNVKFFHETVSMSRTQLGQKIHDLMTQAGWTLEYADVDAIGTGTASNPLWDKAFSTNTSAGKVTYKMPATSLATRWFLTIQLQDKNTNISYDVYFTTSLGVSASGVLTNPGTLCTFENNQNMVAGEHIVTVSEHGIAIGRALQSQYGHYMCCERKRTLIGAPIDDIVIHGYGVNSNPVGFGDSKGTCLSRNLLSGEAVARYYAYLLEGTAPGTQSNAVSSLKGANGLLAIPAGPFMTSGGIGGLSGHVLFFPTADVPLGQTQAVTVDGTNQVFFVGNSAQTHKYYFSFIQS